MVVLFPTLFPPPCLKHRTVSTDTRLCSASSFSFFHSLSISSLFFLLFSASEGSVIVATCCPGLSHRSQRLQFPPSASSSDNSRPCASNGICHDSSRCCRSHFCCVSTDSLRLIIRERARLSSLASSSIRLFRDSFLTLPGICRHHGVNKCALRALSTNRLLRTSLCRLNASDPVQLSLTPMCRQFSSSTLSPTQSMRALILTRAPLQLQTRPSRRQSRRPLAMPKTSLWP